MLKPGPTSMSLWRWTNLRGGRRAADARHVLIARAASSRAPTPPDIASAATNPQKSALRSVGPYALPLPARSSHGAIVAAIGVEGQWAEADLFPVTNRHRRCQLGRCSACPF